MPRLRIHGPLRPRLTMGPVQRNAAAAQVFDPLTSAQAQAQAIDNVTRGFLRWYLWGGLGLLLFALAAAAGAGCLRMLAVLRARSRAGEDAGPHAVAEIWHHLSGAIARMTAIAVAASALAWVAAGGLAYTGTVHGLQQVGSLTDLVGSSSVSPEPAGPAVTGFTGAVIGDSRAVRVGGPPVPDPSPADAACGRSTDSLAAELGNLLAVPVLSLACPSATTSAGLLGPAGAGRAAAAPAGRRAQAGAGAAVRRGRDRAERPGLVRPRHLLLRGRELRRQPQPGRVRLPPRRVRPRLRRAARRAGRAARAAAGGRHDLVRRAAGHRRTRPARTCGAPRERPG